MMPGKKPASQAPSSKTERIESARRRNSGHCRYRWDECERRRNDPPGNHDSGDPNARADSFQKNVGGYFKQEVPDEEQSRAQSEGCFTQTKRLVHVQLGEADID